MDYEDRQKLTWEMIGKREEDLTPEEGVLVKQYHEMLEDRAAKVDKANEQLREDCRIVTSGPEKDLIPAYGWIYPVKEMAYAVEALNILYKKHRICAVFDQVKEKYADFRGYYSIDIADTLPYKILMWPLERLQELLGKVECEVKNVEVVASHDEEVWVERDPKAESDAAVVVEVDGKKLERHVVHVPSRWESLPTKHKLVYKLKCLVNKLLVWQSSKLSFLNKLSREDEVLRERFDTQVEELVGKCEEKCREYCIRCGAQLDEKRNYYSTKGWYTYVCRECARLTRGGLEACTDLAAMEQAKEQKKFEHHLARALEKIEIDPSSSASQLAESLKELGNRKKSKSKWMKNPVGVVYDEEYEDDECDEY